MSDGHQLDCWAEWLLSRRQGGRDTPSERTLQRLHEVRDTVLTNAQLEPTDVLLDVGCGDGLIGFGAVALLPHGCVIFSDISRDLLDHCRRNAQRSGVADRCRFVETPADHLDQIEASSVDVVTTRSVLIYVADKRRAFAEFHRVLRPGGRISLHEPINRFTYPQPAHLFCGYDLSEVAELLAKVRAVFEIREDLERPMVDFDERDLLQYVEQAGFQNIHLDYRVDVRSNEPEEWDRFVNSAGNPLVSTVDEALARALDAGERARFVSILRPLVEEGRGTHRLAVAYLHAAKPAGAASSRGSLVGGDTREGGIS